MKRYLYKITVYFLPKGFLARIGCNVSNGSDSPSVLTAMTRNLYSLPGVSPVTSASAEQTTKQSLYVH